MTKHRHFNGKICWLKWNKLLNNRVTKGSSKNPPLYPTLRCAPQVKGLNTLGCLDERRALRSTHEVRLVICCAPEWAPVGTTTSVNLA